MSLVSAVARVRELDALVDPAPVPVSVSAPTTSFGGALAAASAQPTGYGALAQAAAQRYGVDPSLVTAVMQTESGGDPNATSPAGAEGLMQLMPDTAQSLGVANPYDPAQSLDGGTRYLRQLLDEFGGDERLAVAAYNAGPDAVRRYGGVPPYPETQRYVETVLAAANGGTQ